MRKYNGELLFPNSKWEFCSSSYIAIQRTLKKALRDIQCKRVFQIWRASVKLETVWIRRNAQWQLSKFATKFVIVMFRTI